MPLSQRSAWTITIVNCIYNQHYYSPHIWIHFPYLIHSTNKLILWKSRKLLTNWGHTRNELVTCVTINMVTLCWKHLKMRQTNKPFHGNMRHVFWRGKIVYLQHSLPSATRRSNFTHASGVRVKFERAGSQTATSVPNKQFCPIQNMAHITVKGFITDTFR